MITLLIAFAVNLALVVCITQFFYFPKSHRRDYYFTFVMISIAIFLLIFILNDVKMKTGFALGLFAIFSIIRYRTESMPVREMTYLFTIIAISVINAMIGSLDWQLIAMADAFVLVSVGLCELVRGNQANQHVKLIQYDRIDLIKPAKHEEMIADLKERTGLNIKDVEVGHIDFLKDMAMLRVTYLTDKPTQNLVDQMVKFPKPGEDDGDD